MQIPRCAESKPLAGEPRPQISICQPVESPQERDYAIQPDPVKLDFRTEKSAL